MSKKSHDQPFPEQEELDEQTPLPRDEEQETDSSQNDSSKQPADSIEAKLKEAQNAHRRALADYQNLQRQHSQEREEYIKFANHTLISQLLPVFDSFELAAKHSEDQGIQMVLKQLEQVLEQAGITRISPAEGDTFNPHMHECLETLPTEDDSQNDTIATVSQAGYKWDYGSVIRPAKVTAYKTS